MNSSQIRGLVVLLLLLGGVVAAWLLGRSASDGIPSQAWFQGTAAVDNSTPIMFHKAKIGTVDSVVHEQVGLQLVIARDGLPARSQTVTLQPGDSAHIPEANLTLGFRQNSLTVSTTIQLARIEQSASTPGQEGRWLMIPNPQATDTIMLEDQPLGSLPKEALWPSGEKVGIRITQGERLRVGKFTIQWSPPGVFTRVIALVDTALLTEALGGRSGFGPGAGLRLSSNFGLTQPTLTIEPSFATSPIAHAPNPAIPEFSVRGGFDIEAIANQITDYAFSRSRIASPPTNRYQRVIFDLNNTLANIDSITADLNTFAATPEGVKAAPTTRMDVIVHNIQGASNDLGKAISSINTAAKDIDATVVDVKQTTLPEINRAVLDAKALIERLEITGSELQQLLQKIRTGTLPHLEGDLDEVNADVTRTAKSIQESARSLNRLIEDIRRKLP